MLNPDLQYKNWRRLHQNTSYWTNVRIAWYRHRHTGEHIVYQLCWDGGEWVAQNRFRTFDLSKAQAQYNAWLKWRLDL